jgi:hypothetical protein
MIPARVRGLPDADHHHVLRHPQVLHRAAERVAVRRDDHGFMRADHPPHHGLPGKRLRVDHRAAEHVGENEELFGYPHVVAEAAEPVGNDRHAPFHADLPVDERLDHPPHRQLPDLAVVEKHASPSLSADAYLARPVQMPARYTATTSQ